MKKGKHKHTFVFRGKATPGYDYSHTFSSCECGAIITYIGNGRESEKCGDVIYPKDDSSKNPKKKPKKESDKREPYLFTTPFIFLLIGTGIAFILMWAK